MSVILLVDANYLARRAQYTTGQLSYQGEMTGVAFGFLRDVESQIEMRGITRTLFAFDSRRSLRKKVLPSYKSSRTENLSDEDRQQNDLFYEQLHRLKTELLPMEGFKNIVEVDGYEADDVIAKYAQYVESPDEAIILSADNDLLQCVTENVYFHNPTSKKIVNRQSFIQEWGIPPEQWAQVKALAGCATDDVVGVKGVGEKTAADFFNGKLKKGVRWHLVSENLDLIGKNLPLVKLPFPGIVVPDLVDDEVTEAKKLEVQQVLGIRGRRRVTEGFNL